MKITTGPLIQKYAAAIHTDSEEVRAWVDDYVNNAQQWDNLIAAEMYEASEVDRRESIRKYMEMES